MKSPFHQRPGWLWCHMYIYIRGVMGEQKLLSPVFVLKDMSFLQVHLISLVNVSPGFFFFSHVFPNLFISPRLPLPPFHLFSVTLMKNTVGCTDTCTHKHTHAHRNSFRQIYEKTKNHSWLLPSSTCPSWGTPTWDLGTRWHQGWEAGVLP